MKRKPFNLSKAIIPNTFTALNIFCGFLSIAFASEGEFKTAVVMIVIAGIFDAIDGIVARLLKTSSQFGVELDSLSDIVSFGAAPAFLVYQSHLYQYDWIGMIISSLLVVFGSLRLARFNVQLEDVSVKTDFRGLPIPVSAITIAMFVYSFQSGNQIAEPYSYFLIPLIILLSFLMVSTIGYDALPKPKYMSSTTKVLLLLFISVGLAATIFTDGVALFYIFLSIVLFGIFRKLFNLIFNRKNDDVQINEELN